MDIGHLYHEGVWVWWWANGRLHSYRASQGTHESHLGAVGLNVWRGRYDENTNECSCIPPEHLQNAVTPSWLIDAIQARFGGGVEVHCQNPMKKQKKPEL